MLMLELRPTHKRVKHVCAVLRQFEDPGFRHETVVAAAYDVRGQVIHARVQTVEALNDPLPPE